jgi:hypothetical protein
VNQEELQEFEDTYLAGLNAQLPLTVLPAAGDWDWPAYGVQKVSAVVIGCRALDAAGDKVEIAYVVTIYSLHPLPNYGEVMRESGVDGNCYTFVQLAPSVRSTVYETLLISTYQGANPYPAPLPAGAAALVAPLAGGPTLPHPPP